MAKTIDIIIEYQTNKFTSIILNNRNIKLYVYIYIFNGCDWMQYISLIWCINAILGNICIVYRGKTKEIENLEAYPQVEYALTLFKQHKTIALHFVFGRMAINIS